MLVMLMAVSSATERSDVYTDLILASMTLYIYPLCVQCGKIHVLDSAGVLRLVKAVEVKTDKETLLM